MVAPKIIIFGRYGQLGWEAARILPVLGNVTIYDFPEVDFTHPEAVRSLILREQPQIIFNAAAYTNVDKAESDVQTCRLINAITPGVLAEAALTCGAALLHFSTDYVFDGQKSTPYIEIDPPHPLNMYGQCKLEGDLAILQTGAPAWIFRPSWVYSTRQGGFVTKVLEWARKQTTLRIVDDQISNPTWARFLAEAAVLALAQAHGDYAGWCQATRGVYHLAGKGGISRFEWAKAILELDPHPAEQIVQEILPAKSSEFPTPAVRPASNTLDCTHFEQTFHLCIPEWRSTLQLAMDTGG